MYESFRKLHYYQTFEIINSYCDYFTNKIAIVILLINVFKISSNKNVSRNGQLFTSFVAGNYNIAPIKETTFRTDGSVDPFVSFEVLRFCCVNKTVRVSPPFADWTEPFEGSVSPCFILQLYFVPNYEIVLIKSSNIYDIKIFVKIEIKFLVTNFHHIFNASKLC